MVVLPLVDGWSWSARRSSIRGRRQVAGGWIGDPGGRGPEPSPACSPVPARPSRRPGRARTRSSIARRCPSGNSARAAFRSSSRTVEPGLVDGRRRVVHEPEHQPFLGGALHRPLPNRRGQDVPGDPEEPRGRRPFGVIDVSLAREPGLGEGLRGELHRGARVSAPAQVERMDPAGMPVIQDAEGGRVAAARGAAGPRRCCSRGWDACHAGLRAGCSPVHGAPATIRYIGRAMVGRSASI